ncbi:hypothetical protein JCM11251_006002 [Rhodosporidiobolus azoricus]
MLLSLLLLLAGLQFAVANPFETNLRPKEQTGNTSPTTAGLLPAVCTPDECLIGDNSLTAGVLVSTSVNGTTQRISLLPGTYTSSSAAFSSSSNSSSSVLSSALFSSQRPTSNPSEGFSSSGSLGSSSASFSVGLQAGLTAYTSSLYQGTASFRTLPANYSSANSSSSSNTSASSSKSSFAQSLLLTPSLYTIATLSSSPSTRLVLWESLPDVGEIKGGAGSGGVNIVDVQGTGCTTPCASGGVCTDRGKCACKVGWEGETCGECSSGYFGRSCSACPTGCKDCDDGLLGTGLCLDAVATNVTLPSTCNCINGECASDSAGETCTCNAGWNKAANGTQCAACAEGYYMSSGGDCLACDPSCSSCSSPSGTCLTCASSALQPSSSNPQKCVTATTALSNGTFITCPSRTFFSSSDDTCVDCNPLCESCFKEGTDGCLACRSPNVLLGGDCVAMNSKTGVCDGSKVSSGNGTATGGGYVYDNAKAVCDALPARCTFGAIDNFSSSSTRSQLTCSACLPGSFLVDGKCVPSCHDGMIESQDGLSCEACDSSCSTCSRTKSFCTSCASSSSLILNGTCVSSCPTGYFTPSSTSDISLNSTLLANSTTISPDKLCLPCHADCLACSGSSTTCSTCPSSRPVLTSSSTCVSTCSSTEFYDSSSSSCKSCSDECSTCSGAGSDACLSCPSGKRLKGGKCVEASDCSTWADGFGVCLSDLVTVAAVSAANAEVASKKWKIPWWLILVIVLVVLALIGSGVWWFRKREQKRRREHTKRFAHDLGNKEVDQKLAALPTHIAYPPVPQAPHSPSSPSNPAHLTGVSSQDATYNIPLTPRFVIEDPSSPVSPAPSKSSYAPSEAVPPPTMARKLGSRWSNSSLATSAIAKPLAPQSTGTTSTSSLGAYYSPPRERHFTTAAGNTLVLNSSNSRNPFLSRI